MRSLGYQKLISMEAFRTPNFELVADTLYWLVKSYDPSNTIIKDTSTEMGRVAFIKDVALFVAIKSNVKLNTRKLYGADGYAVKELLKIANLLHSAVNFAEHDDGKMGPRLEFSNKVVQLKSCKSLASEITEKGAVLFDLLGSEISLRDVRFNILAQPFEIENMQQAVSHAIEGLVQQTSAAQVAIENASADESNLRAKIDKKRTEWERANKRLKSLQGVRPAYMDEYEKIEEQLVKLYTIYTDKFRNLSWLEQQLDDLNRTDAEKVHEAQNNFKEMQNRLKQEELDMLKGDADGLGLSFVPNDSAAEMQISAADISLEDDDGALFTSKDLIIGDKSRVSSKPKSEEVSKVAVNQLEMSGVELERVQNSTDGASPVAEAVSPSGEEGYSPAPSPELATAKHHADDDVHFNDDDLKDVELMGDDADVSFSEGEDDGF